MNQSSPCKFNIGDLVIVTKIPTYAETQIMEESNWWEVIANWVTNHTILEVKDSEWWGYEDFNGWWISFKDTDYTMQENFLELVFTV